MELCFDAGLFGTYIMKCDACNGNRKYADKATKQFIHDILDGFYPYEFKDSHPDGVQFLVL